MNMYRFIKYHIYSAHEIRKLIYNIDNENKIKIFGDEFVGNNGNKFSIIYRDKIFHSSSYFSISNINKEDKENKKIEILLLELEDISDRSYMFFNCKSLVEFVDIAYFDKNKNEIKEKPDEKEKYLDSEEINKDNKFYPDSIDESVITAYISNSSNEDIKYFLSVYNKVNRAKENCYVYLKNMRNMFYLCSSLIY